MNTIITALQARKQNILSLAAAFDQSFQETGDQDYLDLALNEYASASELQMVIDNILVSGF